MSDADRFEKAYRAIQTYSNNWVEANLTKKEQEALRMLGRGTSGFELRKTMGLSSTRVEALKRLAGVNDETHQ